MAGVNARRERGRGERVLPGVWRLRLPLPWPGVPHGNAWAVRQGDGFVLFDTGIGGPAAMLELERALEMVELTVEQTKLVVCTHAHLDHCGQAPAIAQRAGCDVYLHPAHTHLLRLIDDPRGVYDERLAGARRAGVPEELLAGMTPPQAGDEEERRRALALFQTALPLVEGVEVETDLGTWTSHYTPGHSPSHVVLAQPGHRLLVSGDHLLGRISLYFDYGYSPDPCGEFLTSLDLVERLGARLCLPGHGRTFADVKAHINGNRELVARRLEASGVAIAAGPLTPFEVIEEVYDYVGPENINWLLSKMMCYLTHLELEGRATREDGELVRFGP